MLSISVLGAKVKSMDMVLYAFLNVNTTQAISAWALKMVKGHKYSKMGIDT